MENRNQLVKSVVRLEGIDKARVRQFIDGWRKIRDLPCEEVKVTELGSDSLQLDLFYSLDTFDHSVAQFMAVLYGEFSSTAVFGKLTFVDLELPDEVYGWFSGPKFGVESIKQRFAVEAWPLLMAIIKPSLGKDLKTEGVKSKVEAVLAGGFHGVKDDEMQGNLPYAPLTERVLIAKQFKRYVLALNLDSLKDYADILAGKGSEEIGAVLLNASIIGFPMLYEIRKITNIPLLSHLAFQGVYTSCFSPKVFAKLHRLFGCDGFITPIPEVGYFNVTKEGQREMIHEFTKDLPIKKTLPMLCGGARLNNLNEVAKPCRNNGLPFGIVFGTLIFASTETPEKMCEKVIDEINKMG